MDALATMVENCSCHLPVLDNSGAVVGLFDIGKCLDDAIAKLECTQEKSRSAVEDVVKKWQMCKVQGMSLLMAQAFGGKSSPKLRSLLAGQPATIVHPGINY
eukprot:11964890-Ditylum_brightwellii.AAC.1